jgi:patatin-like phospholipase/acyl hydrolase
MTVNNNTYNVLSIDGGGIRGLIPALLLVEIERRTGKAISELFDLIAGTSTGGILALGITIPDKTTGKPAYTMKEIVELYSQKGRTIFLQDAWRNMLTGLGVFDEKYPSVGINKVLNDYFGETELKVALTDVLITSYDFENTKQPFFFKSSRAKNDPTRNFKMKDIARATSAAPTYFEPFKLANVVDERIYYSLLDGGVCVNNPAMCALVEAIKCHSLEKIFMVSLGTGAKTQHFTYQEAINWGLVQWIRPLIQVMMNGSNDTVDYQVREMLAGRNNYYRLQIDLPPEASIQRLDNVDPKNIQRLEQLANDLIAQEDKMIDEICARLMA